MSFWTDQNPQGVDNRAFPKSKDQLERDELVRQTLESAARKLDEMQNINETYRYAMRKAARTIREMKP